ncbi:MAG TPA: phosphate ABC transporter permease PstA [Candidatus Mcinerneyibacteriales bacterium]|nr:phosphate ABC transporter permease PstA [Candidatus Mcinerneyibacteriales bacterium]
MKDLSLKKRVFKERLFRGGVFFLASLVVVPLALLLGYIVKKGIGVINWDFLFSMPAGVGESGGGIVHSLAGTVMLIVIAVILSVPVAVATALFINDHPKNRISRMIRFTVDMLQGIPSIIMGIVVYLWVVLPMKNFSSLAGGVALGIMMLPIVIKSTEETLKMVPESLKEASMALGAPYYKTVLHVILPAGLSGILTGVLLGVSRIAGETAPLLFTAFGNPFLNTDIFKPVDALPLLIYNYSTSPYPEWHSLAWGASFILVAFVLILNLITRLVVKKWQIKY